MTATVSFVNGQFTVRTEYWDNHRPKGAPNRRWDKSGKCWLIPAIKPCAIYILETFKDHEIEEPAYYHLARLTEKEVAVVDEFPKDYKFLTYQPKQHQIDALNRAWGRKSYAFFFEMRLGKTFTALNLFFARHQAGQVDQLLILCPTPIKDVWAEQIKLFQYIEFETQVLTAGKKVRPGTEILIVGIEALSQGHAYDYSASFAAFTPTMIICDESSRIKNHKAGRTERAIELADECEYKVTLTGTSITQGIQDLYSQYRFLDWRIIGQKSFYTFRNRYCVMGGFEGKQIVGYDKVDELMDLVAPYTSMVKKEDVYDLPQMPPQRRWLDAPASMKKMFAELRKLMKTEYEGEEVTIENTLERMTRFQQINGGNFPVAEGKDKKGKTIWGSRPLGTNPKLQELANMLDEFGDQQVIIWARFVPEIEAIRKMLSDSGKTVVTFYGADSDAERVYNRDAFQAGEAQFIIANQSVGGMGQEFSAATICVFFSNTFSYEDRQQAWSRPEKMGMEDPVLYIDLLLKTPVDRAIMASQDMKGGLASYVNDNMQSLERELWG